MTPEAGPLIDASVELADLEALLVDFQQALAWMGSYSKVSPHCRWRHYEKLLANIVGRVKYQNPDLPHVEEGDARNACYEVAQLRTIYRQFKQSQHPALGRKLAIVSKGNVNYTQEAVDARARDTAFELFLAATFLEKGLHVSIGDEKERLEDLRVIMDEFDLYVECKRPASERSVRACADAAFKQLSKRLDQADRRAFGAVAFAIDRVKNPTSAYIQAKASRHIHEALTSRTAAFIDSQLGYWNTNRPSNVLLAFVQLCGSAYVDDLPFGIFSPVVTVERFVPLLTDDCLNGIKAVDHIFAALAVNEE